MSAFFFLSRTITRPAVCGSGSERRTLRPADRELRMRHLRPVLDRPPQITGMTAGNHGAGQRQHRDEADEEHRQHA